MQLAWRRPSRARRVEAMPDHGRRGARSIRTLSTLALVLIGALALVALSILVWNSHDTRRATHEGFAAVESQALINDAQVALLTHRRLSNQWVITLEPALDEARIAQADLTQRSLEQAAAKARNRHERALTELTARQVAAYFQEREDAEAATRDIAALTEVTRPYLDRALLSLTRLRQLHERDVDDANAEIARAVLVSDVLAGALTTLLIGALIFTLWGVRRWIVQPLLVLHGVIERFRNGDIGARAPPEGARELHDVSDAYNAMADTIAAQRDGQLAYLAGVAHDLRNPLGAMKMGITLVECHEATERARHTLALLDRQTDRMSRMVDDLLDATLIEGGQLQMKPEPFDLADRVRECVALHGPVFPAHTITLDVPDRPVMIHADPVRIDQVLTNLLTNALKFSPSGSRIDVRVALCANDAMIEVTDRGIGMTRDEMRDLFSPFRRRAPDVAPGLGIGLSVVRRIVEAHGGRIEVESEPSVGSTFRVTLPRESAEAVSGGRSGMSAPHHSAATR